MADRFAAGSLPALQFSRFSARGSMASPCGSSHGPLLATKCNKSDNSTWQMPAQKIMENNRWEGRHSLDFSRTFTACGQLPASGDATRAASNMNYILNRAGGLSPVATQATGGGGYPTRGTDILGYPLSQSSSVTLTCSRPHGRRRFCCCEPGSL